MKTLALAAILGTMLLPAQEAPARPSVTGAVISSTNGDLVRKAAVTLTARDDAKGMSYEVETDANGRFLINDVEPGSYSITADRQGFQFESEGAPGAPPPTLKVEAGQSVKDVKIKLAPLGVITGRVLDEDGDPSRGARVEALTYAYLNGKKQLRSTDQATANDKGEFRLFGLRPGTFYLRATGRNFGLGRMSFRTGGVGFVGGPGRGAGATYFPATTEASHAAAIEVSAGAQLRGFDIRLRQEPRYAVRGKLPGSSRNVEGEGPRTNYMLQLVHRGGINQGFSMGFSLNMDDQNFEFADVSPGSYVIVCTPNNGENEHYARQPVEVVNSDVEGITLTRVTPADVSGVVRVEGTPRRPLEKLHVRLQLDDIMGFGQESAEVKPDGSFLLANVVPDVYQVIIGAHQSTYVKSIKFGDEEAPGGRIDLTKGSGSVTVLLGTDVGEVEGSVKNAKGDPAERVRVTLIAYGSHLGQIDFSRSGFTDDQGKFHLRNIAPGEYKIFAWEDVPVGAPQDPDFRKPFEKQAAAVKMESNGHETVELTAISVKAARHANQ